MDKNKSLYISLVVLFCVVITGISAFFLGLQFSKQNSINNSTKNESKITNVESYNIPTLSILYYKKIKTLLFPLFMGFF